MNLHKGVLRKMGTALESPVRYELQLGDEPLTVNNWIGHQVSLTHIGYECLGCGEGKKIYRQGHCYDCFFKLPQTADWVIRPELSQAHLGIEDRDLEFEKKTQLQPHVVYLAKSSSIKVGVTRKAQIPTRWIDQGANEAMAIVEVPNRYLAGITEVALKSLLTDKTNWRKMLKNEVSETALEQVRDEVLNSIPVETQQYIIEAPEIIAVKYPVEQYPQKIKSLNLEKAKSYTGNLVGIKGQYLIFEDDTVFNIRNNEGLIVDVNVSQADNVQQSLF